MTSLNGWPSTQSVHYPVPDLRQWWPLEGWAEGNKSGGIPRSAHLSVGGDGRCGVVWLMAVEERKSLEESRSRRGVEESRIRLRMSLVPWLYKYNISCVSKLCYLAVADYFDTHRLHLRAFYCFLALVFWCGHWAFITYDPHLSTYPSS